MEIDTHICPSLLRETGGEVDTHPKPWTAFDGENISCELPYKHFDDNVGIDIFNNNKMSISVSRSPVKYSLVADDGCAISKEGEQGEFILKPVLIIFVTGFVLLTNIWQCR